MTAGLSASQSAIAIAATDSVHQTLASIARAFRDAGIEGVETDARFLVQGVLGLDAASLLRDPDRLVGACASQLEEAVRRRLAHEPVSRILGQRDFYGRSFKVTPDVLDPRADTETLVDLVLDIVRADERLQGAITIADIGVGSGAILVTLLAELPFARGIAIDVSRAALEVAVENARACGVDDRMTAVATRGLEGIAQPIDIIVSNPPYIVTSDIERLDASVRQFDPRLALDGGPDGLQIYREIARDISKIKRDFWIVLECGAGQAADVQNIFSQFSVHQTMTRTDLGGHSRVVALEIHC